MTAGFSFARSGRYDMTHTMYPYRRHWAAILAVLSIAAATGAWMRFGLVYGFPADLQFVNIRHAHSHLMYFGWVTPALMALIGHHLPQLTARRDTPRFTGPIVLCLVFGLLAYPAFLLYGYQPAAIAGRAIPLSIAAAALNVIGWYWFAWRYAVATRGAPRSAPLRILDGAVLSLVGATLGVWGLPVVTALQVDGVFWPQLLTHLFLDLFAEGWLVLGVLGVAYAARPSVAGHPRLGRAVDLVLLGVPFVFLFNMAPSSLLPPLRWLSAAAVALLAVGMLLHVSILWRHTGWMWWLPLACLVLQSTVKLVGFVPDGFRWAIQMGLRIPYLHWLLLGWVTVGLFAAAVEAWGDRAAPALGWLSIAVAVHLAALMPLTRLWPAALKGSWAPPLAAWTALGPVLLVVVALGRLLLTADRPRPLPQEPSGVR